MTVEEDIKRAIECMRKGGVILYPTDTVWGIGCDATNAEAVERIYRLKRSENKKSMLVLCATPDMVVARYFRNVPQVAWDFIDAAMPVKPTTVILDDASGVANNLVAEDGSLAMRITYEPFSKQLCYRFQKPIVSTSANVSGEPAAQNYRDISEEILNAVDYVCWSRRQEHKPHQPSSIVKIAKDGEVKVIR